MSLSLLVCFAAMFAVSTALPTGAPGPPTQVCDNLMPSGPHVQNGIVEQPTPNPWTIDVCDFDEIMGYYTYSPGVTYNITLRPAQGAAITLRGFLVQGRTQMGNEMVGTFLDPSGIDPFTQLSLCDIPSVGVTHNNPNRTDESGPFTFQWTAPAAGTGPIWFRYTIMQNVATWWADDSSAIVQEVNNLVFPNSGTTQLQGVGFWALLITATGVALKTFF